MNEIFEYFKSYGIDIGEILKSYGLVFNESSSPIIGFIFIIFILSSIAILCFINIAIYYGVILYFDNPARLEKITGTLPKPLLRLFNFYRKTRSFFLIFELTLFMVSLGSIVWLCGRILLGVLN